MSKQITAEELAEIVTRLLTDQQTSGELDSYESYSSFMTEIANVVCNHCGGEVRVPASPWEEIWYVGIHGNDSLADAFGGIWREYDKDGELFDTEPTPRSELPPESNTNETDPAPLKENAESAVKDTPADFLRHVAGLRIWSYDSDLRTSEELKHLTGDGGEKEEPSEGFLDSHTCLMDLIEQARRLQKLNAVDAQSDLETLMLAIVRTGQQAGIIRADLESVSTSQCLQILTDLAGASILASSR